MPYPTHRFRGLLALLALAVVAGGCAVLEPDPRADQRRALREARARWEAQGLTTYRFVFTASCECAYAYARARWITVVDDSVVSTESVDGGTSTDVGPSAFRSIDELFDLIAETIDNRHGDAVARYESQVGYPISASLDRDRRYVDDEITFSVSALAPYAPPAGSR